MAESPDPGGAAELIQRKGFCSQQSLTGTAALIIYAMRFFVLLLLVLLLPLRSGLGDAMAASVNSPHHGAQHQEPQQHKEHQANVMASAAHAHAQQDCAGHGGSGHGAAHATTVESLQTSTNADGVAAADAACDACSACQTCHAVGLAFSRAEVQPLPAPNAQPAALSSAFASAAAARDQKPPIS